MGALARWKRKRAQSVASEGERYWSCWTKKTAGTVHRTGTARAGLADRDFNNDSLRALCSSMHLSWNRLGACGSSCDRQIRILRISLTVNDLQIEQSTL